MTRLLPLLVAAALLATTGCVARDSDLPVSAPQMMPSGQASQYGKVLIIPMENKRLGEVIGDPDAPYLNQLAHRFGTATRMDAGYPVHCPSLAAYILMTSGSTHGICDDNDANRHRLGGENVFDEVADAKLEWRTYAESMGSRCQRTNAHDERYVPRHAPAPYYTSEKARCVRWDLPMGSAARGAFHDDLARGALPAFAFLTPDNCHNMHGAPGCEHRTVRSGDDWLGQWIPRILSAPDYRAGRLVIVITWDEGTDTSNHIPTLVLSPTTRGVSATDPYTHCSTLRTVEEILRLPLIGCSRGARSLRSEFHV